MSGHISLLTKHRKFLVHSKIAFDYAAWHDWPKVSLASTRWLGGKVHNSCLILSILWKNIGSSYMYITERLLMTSGFVMILKFIFASSRPLSKKMHHSCLGPCYVKCILLAGVWFVNFLTVPLFQAVLFSALNRLNHRKCGLKC